MNEQPLTPDHHDAVVERVAMIIDGLLPMKSMDGLTNLRKHQAVTYSTSFLLEIEPLLKRGDDTSLGIASKVFQGVNQDAILNALHYSTLLQYEDFKLVYGVVAALRSYPGMDNEPETFNIATKRTLGLAFVKVGCALSSVPEVSSMSFTDPEHPMLSGPLSQLRIRHNEMIELVLERAHDIDRIVTIIEDHGVWKANLIRAIADGIAPSLADGAL